MAYRKARILHPVFGSIARQPTGYWRIFRAPWRNYYLHRAVWEHAAGHKLPEGWEVHHMDHNKDHNCRCNLLAMPKEMHKMFYGNAMKHPYTGKWITRREYEKVMGVKLSVAGIGTGTVTWTTCVDMTPGSENEVPF